MAAISVDRALDLGYVIDYDETGRMFYIDQEGRIINPETGIAVSIASGSIGESAASESWVDKLGGFLTQGLSFAQAWQQQKAFNEANKVRAQQGLAPLPWTDFRPTASVGVTLDPKILWTVAGVGLLIALAMFGGRRR